MQLTAWLSTRFRRLLFAGAAATIAGLIPVLPTSVAVALGAIFGVVVAKALAEVHVATRQAADRSLREHTAREKVEQALAARFETGMREVADSLSTVRTQLDSLEDEVAAGQTQLASVEQQLASVEQQVQVEQQRRREAMERLHDELSKQAAAQGARLDQISASLAEDRRAGSPLATYQPFPRLVEQSALNQIGKEWGGRLGMDLGDRDLAYLVHRIALLDDACLGRLAASSESALVRLLVARAVAAGRRDSGTTRMLEIGTLFGVGLGVLYEGVRVITTDVQLSVIDPLDGYYEAGRRDIITGEPVTEEVVRENIARMQLPPSSFELMKGLSGEMLPELARAGRRYDLVVIDGDHTYEGVRTDVEGVLPILAAGGTMIFDDYGNSAWPEVKEYVDEHVLTRDDLKEVGVHANTLVVRSEVVSLDSSRGAV